MILRNLALLFVLMAACGHARSEPIPLACTGKMTAARRHVTEDYTIAITVDLRAKTVTVGSFGTVPIVSNTDDDSVVFMLDKNSTAQVSTGTLNRITRRGECAHHYSHRWTLSFLWDL
jgi:hypothetical protein